jgi:CBS domain containing-hemolysin-like protein
MEVLSLLLGVLVVLAITAVTGYFVAQEFAYMAVDRSGLNARAPAGDRAAERACWSPAAPPSCCPARSRASP